MKKILKYSTLLLLCAAVFSCSKGVSDPDPDPEEPTPTPAARPDMSKVQKAPAEMRAIWMATVYNIDWPWTKNNVSAQKQQYIEYLDMFKQYNLNTVIVQIRPAADAFFNSEIDPWSQYLTGTQGQDPGYDVLRFLIDEAHKRGMEFHAWMNPYRISPDRKSARFHEKSIAKRHPEYTFEYGESLLLLRPGMPEVRKYLLDVIDEVITKYDIDGLHFDDYFYPYPESGASLDDADEYARYGKSFSSIEDWRRNNVTLAIKEISELIRSKRPDMVFGVSPFGTWKHNTQDPAGSPSKGSTNFYDLYADVRLWCEKGYLDYIAPQLYNATTSSAQPFVEMVQWWGKSMYDVPVFIGQGIYRFESGASTTAYRSVDELNKQVNAIRSTKGVMGSFLYNSNSFKANRLNILGEYSKLYKKPSLIPFMGRKTLTEPTAPQNVAISGNTISWSAPSDKSWRAVVYNITSAAYATPVAITSAQAATVPSSGFYAVTFVNGDNVEGTFSTLVEKK